MLKDGQVSWQGVPADFFRNLELVEENLVKPLPLTVVGDHLVRAGLIGRDEIPLDLESAVALVERLTVGRPLPAPEQAAASSDPAQPVIEIHDLVHTYPGGHRGLSGVNLSIQAGEYVALSDAMAPARPPWPSI